MSGFVKPALLVLLVALCSHLAVIQLLPGFIMSVAMDRISDGAATTAAQRLRDGGEARVELLRSVVERKGWNAPIAAPPADHSQRVVVRASADILYSACVFDLAEGPLHVTAPKSGGYTSISAFAANTDNFFVLDDRQLEEPALSVVIHRSSQAAPSSVKGSRVLSPTRKGIVLVRYLIENKEVLERYIDRQHEIACDPL